MDYLSTSDIFNFTIWGILLLYIGYKFISSIQVVPQRTERIVERLGKYSKTLKPGFHALIPFLDKVTSKTDKTMTFSRLLDPKRDVFLFDHQREGIPIFLGATGLESMAEYLSWFDMEWDPNNFETPILGVDSLNH